MAVDITEWMPLIQTLSGAVLAGSVAIGVSWLNHIFAREREEKASGERLRQEQVVKKEKSEIERLFIATELIFLLEEFAEGCARAGCDPGAEDERGTIRATVSSPEINLKLVAGDWRVLPAPLMYRIRELPILLNEAKDYIANVWEYDWPPDYSDTFRAREYRYSRLGLKAVLLAVRLRRLVELPPTRLDANEWSAQPVLRALWHGAIRRRAEAAKHAQTLLSVMELSRKQTPSGEPE